MKKRVKLFARLAYMALCIILITVFLCIPFYQQEIQKTELPQTDYSYLRGYQLGGEILYIVNQRTAFYKISDPILQFCNLSNFENLIVIGVIISKVGYVYYYCHRRRIKIIAPYKSNWIFERTSKLS